MKNRIWTRWLVTIVACVISGAVTGYVYIGLGAGNAVGLPITLIMGGFNYLTLPLLLQFMSPGIIFGLAFSMSAVVGNWIENRPASLVRASLSVVAYTVASIITWYIAYWIVVIPYNGGLRNLIFPGAIAGLCGGFMLSLAALVLPKARARRVLLWTTVAGAVAGILFFLNPVLSNDLASTSGSVYPVVAWCLSFALWQGAVGATLAISLGFSAAAGAGTSAITTAAVAAARPIELQTLASPAPGTLPKKRNIRLLQIGAALGLFVVVLLAAAV